MLKPLLCAVGGAAVGFYIAKLRYEKAAYAYATERIEQAKVYAEERADREIQKFQAEAEAGVVAEVSNIFESLEEISGDDDLEKVEKLVVNPAVENLIKNYQRFSSPEATTETEEDSESHIVLIRRKEFFEGPVDGYDQTTVTYYQNEDILVEYPSDKQLDVKAAVGSIRPNWFGQEADDENVCYVRNTNIKIEFEVNRSQGSYAKDVLGLGDNGAE